ncbi:hypothetical protein VCRA2119O147_580035 [Vibrio crassostreae]|nr:hypothetical protein VCRA2116O234_130090 [Vibrio crassostreae]CAK1767862.1 hypothetical protein VCRA2113O138_150017 [Vibrio crassostreae]CAK1772503.1 hypothetical protein VCRA2113O204_150045 [Vibrio crassostreae]CAK1774183.1 hypothetical protein VCRA2110O177_150045 [Vibrio crassostreae]CAK1776261.1 hypothetical protein VCRA2110O181_150075 [Vibrio crassostreae]
MSVMDGKQLIDLSAEWRSITMKNNVYSVKVASSSSFSDISIESSLHVT